jgi:transposase InsO family protein
MSKARLVITAVVLEGRSQAEVARAYGVSEGWVSKLLARYREEGDRAFEARSRKPRHSPSATPPEVVRAVVTLRRNLSRRGLDAGAKTIVWHLAQRGVLISVATVNRILSGRGLVVAQPKKRPRSSYVRFEAEMPNECWQSDVTHWTLADGTDAEILTFLDDHSRAIVHMSAHRVVSGAIVHGAFLAATKRHGIPASTLTDNGMVFTTRLSGGKGGRNAFESELRRLGVRQKNSRPNHPTTCGKVERLHQTIKKWLAARPRQPSTIRGLQRNLDLFVEEYNCERPHSSLRPARPPLEAYAARPKATPGDRSDDRHLRVRSDRIDTAGKVTLRLDGQLYSIGIGRAHTGTRVTMLVEDLDVRVVDAQTGELLRELTIDLTKKFQATGRPRGRGPRSKG